MEHVAAALYRWLMKNNIDPDKVSLVIRANDAVTLERMERAFNSDTRMLQIPMTKTMTVQNVRFVITRDRQLEPATNADRALIDDWKLRHRDTLPEAFGLPAGLTAERHNLR